MSDKYYAALRARANEYLVQARLAMDSAEKETDDHRRSEYLNVALGWLKLAAEIRGETLAGEFLTRRESAE
jgi:hypothetical protein